MRHTLARARKAKPDRPRSNQQLSRCRLGRSRSERDTIRHGPSGATYRQAYFNGAKLYVQVAYGGNWL